MLSLRETENDFSDDSDKAEAALEKKANDNYKIAQRIIEGDIEI